MIGKRGTSEQARETAELFAKSDANLHWECVEMRFFDSQTVGSTAEHANKWVVEFKADQGEWDPATKLIAVNSRFGACIDWGC